MATTSHWNGINVTNTNINIVYPNIAPPYITDHAIATFSGVLNIANRNNAAVKVRVGISNSSSQVSISDSEYILFDLTIPAYGGLERTGILIPPGHYLKVRSDTPDVTASVYGYVETY